MKCPKCGKSLKLNISSLYATYKHGNRASCKYYVIAYKKIKYGYWLPAGTVWGREEWEAYEKYMKDNGYIDREDRYGIKAE